MHYYFIRIFSNVLLFFVILIVDKIETCKKKNAVCNPSSRRHSGCCESMYCDPKSSKCTEYVIRQVSSQIKIYLLHYCRSWIIDRKYPVNFTPSNTYFNVAVTVEVKVKIEILVQLGATKIG